MMNNDELFKLAEAYVEYIKQDIEIGDFLYKFGINTISYSNKLEVALCDIFKNHHDSLTDCLVDLAFDGHCDFVEPDVRCESVKEIFEVLFNKGEIKA